MSLLSPGGSEWTTVYDSGSGSNGGWGSYSNDDNWGGQLGPSNPYTNMDTSTLPQQNMWGTGAEPFPSSGGSLGDLSFSNPTFNGDTSFSNFGNGTNGDYSGYFSGGQQDPFGADSSYDLSGGQGGYEKMYPQGNAELKKWQNLVKPFQPYLKNPVISTLMGLHPIGIAAKMLLGGPQGVGGGLGGMLGNALGGIPGALAGGLGGSQLANYATNGSFAPITSSTLGSMFGAGAGAYSGAPLGSAIGGFMGRQIGGQIDKGNLFTNSGTDGGNPGMSSGNVDMMRMLLGSSGGNAGNDSKQSPVENLMNTTTNSGLLGGLAGLYLGNRAQSDISGQIKSLQGLYGQDSPYSQVMRQQLERRDAAAGRRSQYGTREVELQAALAGNASRLAPTIAQLSGQKTNYRNLMASSLLKNQAFNDMVSRGLSSLFSSPGAYTGMDQSTLPKIDLFGSVNTPVFDSTPSQQYWNPQIDGFGG